MEGDRPDACFVPRWIAHIYSIDKKVFVAIDLLIWPVSWSCPNVIDLRRECNTGKKKIEFIDKDVDINQRSHHRNEEILTLVDFHNSLISLSRFYKCLKYYF